MVELILIKRRAEMGRNSAQVIVNAIDSSYGLDSSGLSDSEIESLIESLRELQQMDREGVVSPLEDGTTSDDEDLELYDRESLDEEF
jgi:hypothetical protein